MRSNTLPIVALGSLLALGVGGCSFALAVRPPDPSEWPREGQANLVQQKCTSSVLPPILDTAASLLLFGAAFIERDFHTRWAPISLGVAGLGPAASAVYGYGVTAECRKYQGQFERAPSGLTSGSGGSRTPPPPPTPAPRP
jgi:hypothetical protein